jgi:hypothetical protein
MQTAPQLMLSHGNGNKVLTAPNGGNAIRRLMVELQDKIARVGGGDLDVTVGFATRNGGRATKSS